MSSDSKAPVRLVKRVQFGILSPDEIVSNTFTQYKDPVIKIINFFIASNVSH